MSANQEFSAALLGELVRSGVRHACICPGSRSTPLTAAAVALSSLRCWSHIDERAAAFFAVGLARASRTPVQMPRHVTRRAVRMRQRADKVSNVNAVPPLRLDATCRPSRRAHMRRMKRYHDYAKGLAAEQRPVGAHRLAPMAGS